MLTPSLQQTFSGDSSQPAGGDTSSDDGSNDDSVTCPQSMPSPFKSPLKLPPVSFPNSPRKVPLLTTIVAILVAIYSGLSAGKHYAALVATPAIDVAPQCEEADISSQIDATKRPVFQFAEIDDDDEDEDDDEDDDDEDDDEDDDGDDEDDAPVDGSGNILQVWMMAYELDDHFEDFEPHNTEKLISEFLEDMLEASDECEALFELHGHFALDSQKLGGHSGTLQAIGMFRDGGGHVSVAAWPSQAKILVDLLINPPRTPGSEPLSDENLFACIDSIAKFLYPDDVIKLDGIDGSRGNLSHISQVGPAQVWSKYGKDPLRFKWWIAKDRGFRKMDANEFDLFDEMGSSDDWSYLVKSVQSTFQRIDIVDALDDYEILPLSKYFTNPELSEERKYIETHPEFFTPDRILFLDGVTQSTMEGLAAYHEALVQPAMFTHPNPKRVAIVGGGECATLRETLKHNTVEKVVMVEIDPVIVEVSKNFLPEWNDCSMFEGSSRYCMDDPRVEMYHLDALKWFRDRFSDEARLEGHEFYGSEEKFDVVILDALDPQNAVDFVEALYGDGPFMNSLFNSLTDDGVLLTQVGEAISIGDEAENAPNNFNYQRFMYESGLKNQGFKVVFNYEEPRAGFDGIWSFYAAFKSDASRARWQMNEAQFDLEIQKRSIRRVKEEERESGEVRGLFDYFDGPTMATYRHPSKDAQVVFCQRDPKPYGCTTDIRDHHALRRPVYEPIGFDPEIPNLSAENFAVSGDGGLVSRVDVPEKSYLMAEQSIHDAQITPSMSAILQSKNEIYDQTIGPVANFVGADRGVLTIPRRGASYSSYRVDSGLLSFLSHGCDGRFNTESITSSSITEATADPDLVPEDGLLGRSYSNMVVRELVFNPSHTRNSHLPEFLISSGNITEGDGITTNYVPWYNDAGWKTHIESLRSKCESNL